MCGTWLLYTIDYWAQVGENWLYIELYLVKKYPSSVNSRPQYRIVPLRPPPLTISNLRHQISRVLWLELYHDGGSRHKFRIVARIIPHRGGQSSTFLPLHTPKTQKNRIVVPHIRIVAQIIPREIVGEPISILPAPMHFKYEKAGIVPRWLPAPTSHYMSPRPQINRVELLKL